MYSTKAVITFITYAIREVHSAFKRGLIDKQEKEANLNALLISLGCLEELEEKKANLLKEFCNKKANKVKRSK